MRGRGAARNYVASMSTAEYLIFFDADDLPRDGALIPRLAAAIRASAADCITVPYDLVDHRLHGTCQTASILCAYRPMGSCVEGEFFENIFGDTTMIVKRSVFEALGGFPKNGSRGKTMSSF